MCIYIYIFIHLEYIDACIVIAMYTYMFVYVLSACTYLPVCFLISYPLYRLCFIVLYFNLAPFGPRFGSCFSKHKELVAKGLIKGLLGDDGG